ncbi:MAG: hypothetical protein ACR2N3_09875 [Pyrinomonadaceae bacterium]
MKNRRLKQIAFSLCIVLSLLASSVSARACPHCHEVKNAESSCHEHSQMTMEMPDESNRAETIQNAICKTGCCNCVQPAPQVFSKSAFLKIEKQTAEISPAISFKIETIPQIISTGQTNFVKSFYLSDSFYNIKSPRAPPRL